MYTGSGDVYLLDTLWATVIVLAQAFIIVMLCRTEYTASWT